LDLLLLLLLVRLCLGSLYLGQSLGVCLLLCLNGLSLLCRCLHL
jgi:hypothetical protein